MLRPQAGSDSEAVQTLAEAEAGFSRQSQMKTTRHMNPNRIIELGLNKGTRKVNGACCPTPGE